MQSASIASALPFAIIMLIAALGIWRALVIENHRDASLLQEMNIDIAPAIDSTQQWRNRLTELIAFPQKEDVITYIAHDVHEGMQKIKKELSNSSWHCDVQYDKEHIRSIITIYKDQSIKFVYEVRLKEYTMPEFALLDSDKPQEHYYNAEVFLRRGGLQYDVYGFEEHTVINDIITQFQRYLRFIHTSPGTLPWNMDEHDTMLSNDLITNK